MKKNAIFVCVMSVLALSFVIGFYDKAQASYTDVLRVINSTSNTINSVNRAGRGTMSTVEYSQRFLDRQQDRKDRKRAEKEYNANAEAEYYRTLQETQQIKAYGYQNNL